MQPQTLSLEAVLTIAETATWFQFCDFAICKSPTKTAVLLLCY
jgi:hypothetical protein